MFRPNSSGLFWIMALHCSNLVFIKLSVNENSQIKKQIKRKVKYLLLVSRLSCECQMRPRCVTELTFTSPEVELSACLWNKVERKWEGGNPLKISPKTFFFAETWLLVLMWEGQVGKESEEVTQSDQCLVWSAWLKWKTERGNGCERVRNWGVITDELGRFQRRELRGLVRGGSVWWGRPTHDSEKGCLFDWPCGYFLTWQPPVCSIATTSSSSQPCGVYSAQRTIWIK